MSQKQTLRPRTHGLGFKASVRFEKEDTLSAKPKLSMHRLLSLTIPSSPCVLLVVGA